MSLHLIQELARAGQPVHLPKQEFEVGERVRCHTCLGTVVEYLPQAYADNLFRIAWDDDESDTDFYPSVGLNNAHDAERAA